MLFGVGLKCRSLARYSAVVLVTTTKSDFDSPLRAACRYAPFYLVPPPRCSLYVTDCELTFLPALRRQSALGAFEEPERSPDVSRGPLFY